MRIASLIFPTTAVCPSSHPQQQFGYDQAPKKLCSAVTIPKRFSHLKLGCSNSNNGESSSQVRGSISANSSYPSNQQQYQEQYQPWKSGNVEADFQKLRSAVHKSRADTSLTFWESQFEDDYFAYNRRPLQADFIRYIALPLASSTLLSLPMLNSSTIIPGRHFKVAMRIGAFLMDTYYYMFCLAFPLLLWPLLHREDARLKEIERRNERVSPWNDLRLKPMYEDRCNNHCLCLIDLLVSCILPTTILLTIVFFPRNLVHNKFNFLDRSVSTSSSQATHLHLQNFMIAILKLVTRLGSTVSLYQYGKHIFELNRANQPRPLPKYTVILQQYVNSMTKMLPTGLLFDLTSIMCRFRNTERKEHLTLNLIKQSPKFFRYGFLASIIPPLIHFIAFLRLIRVFYGKNESFTNPVLKSDPRIRVYSTETDYFSTERLTFNNVDQHSVTWRWCLKWRRRRRVIDTIERWWILFIADFDLNKFFEPDYYHTSERELQKILSYEDRHMSKTDDVAELSQEQVFVPLEARVAGMQARIAARHRQEYKKAEGRKHDPLGIAVEKYLGLGLNFNYDHMRKLRENETPSLNRLFARAAKSAVKRIQQLEHQNNVTLESIEDTEEKAMVAAKMGKQLQEEREYLARTLLLLQPRSDDKGAGDDIFRDEEGESSKVLQFLPRSAVEKFGQPVVTSTGSTPDPFEVALEKTSGEEAIEKFRSDEQKLADKRKGLLQKHSVSGEDDIMEEDDNQIVFC